MEFLTFRLYASLSSWGEMAVGESRHSASYPSRSALLGLIGAAIGLKREDEASQKSMAKSCAFGVKVLSPGSLLKDYHTTQVPDAVGKYRYATRREELVLGVQRLGTILSSRDYRQDAQSIIAVKNSKNASFLLQEIHNALMFPKFHLYLGRKSCPLSLPLAPQIADAEDFKSALDSYELKPFMRGRFPQEDEKRHLPVRPEQIRYYWEGEENDFAAQLSTINSKAVQSHMRNDVPISRGKWQFGKRREYSYQYIVRDEEK